MPSANLGGLAAVLPSCQAKAAKKNTKISHQSTFRMESDMGVRDRPIFFEIVKAIKDVSIVFS